MKNILCIKESVGKPVVFKGHTVITTELLSQAYETSADNIKVNFSRNKGKFEEGKHYILLQGEELKEFKSQVTESYLPIEISKFASQLYLWTERGASRHCKILDTDKAWEQFDYLEDTYFMVKQQSPMCLEDLIIANAKALKEAREQAELATTTAIEAKAESKAVKEEVQAMRDVITLDHKAWKDDAKRIIVSIAQKFGGNQYIQDVWKEAYSLLEHRGRTKLDVRLNNRRKNIFAETGSMSKANKYNKLDVIDEEAKLRETFIAIVKEMAIKYGIA